MILLVRPVARFYFIPTMESKQAEAEAEAKQTKPKTQNRKPNLGLSKKKFFLLLHTGPSPADDRLQKRNRSVNEFQLGGWRQGYERATVSVGIH